MKYLLTPGPVPVPEFVLSAITQPVIHHRTQEFTSFYQQFLENLKYLFQTQSVVGTMIGSGTSGVETAIYTLFNSADTVLVCDNGKFSQRWADYSKLLGLNVILLKKKWGEAPSEQEILSIIRENEDINGIILTHSETSTGALLDLEEIAFSIKSHNPNLLILVDGITSVGTIPFYFDQWGIDCAITASQKALMNPAGTIAFALSELALGKMKETDFADFNNLYNYVKAAKAFSYPYTAPVQLLYGLGAALEYIKETGLPAVWNKTHHSAKVFREIVKKLGGKFLSDSPSESLTAFYFPDLDNEMIRQKLIEDHEIHLSGGQGEFKGKVMRISHMGMADVEMMKMVGEKLRVILDS